MKGKQRGIQSNTSRLHKAIRDKKVPDGLTNINKIVARIYKTGEMPPARPGAQYANVSEVPDLQGSMNAKIRADEYIKQNPPKPVKTGVTTQPAVGLVPSTTNEGQPPTTPSKPPSKETA